jgi:hypothetical protein
VSVPELPDLNADELLAALSERAVEFVVVGGMPAELADLEVGPTAELLARTSMTRWFTRAGVVDVLHEIPAGEGGQLRGCVELEPNAVAVRGPNATVLVAALDDIIASKEHANRDKDRDALPELYALRDRPEGGSKS